jgi:hypothetical protein
MHGEKLDVTRQLSSGGKKTYVIKHRDGTFTHLRERRAPMRRIAERRERNWPAARNQGMSIKPSIT